MASIATQNAEIQGKIRKFQTEWAKLLPGLQRDPTVPVSYVLDTVQALIDGIGNPVADIEGRIIAQMEVLERGSIAASIGVGGGAAAVFEGVANQIRSATAAATSTMRFLFNERLIPLRNEALQARARGQRMMKIPVAGVGTELFKDPFDQTVVATMTNGAAALAAVSGIQAQIDSTIIGRFAGGVVDAADKVTSALSALGTAIATIGKGFYDVFKTLFLVAKVALVGGIGYVGYRIYREARPQRALPAPQQNPRRRRTRHRR